MKKSARFVWAITVAVGLAAIVPIAAAETASKPDLQMVDGEGLKKAIADQHGKVVLVNLWATWCEPCVEEFPSLVKLANTLRSKGLVVIGISMDEPRDAEKVAGFLKGQKAGFPVYIRKGGDVDAFFDPVDKQWTGAVPTTYIFDRNGKPVGKPLIGRQTYAAFDAAVKSLVK